jgi:HPt (histidine-containing phosphotransfer) domain-containing protein
LYVSAIAIAQQPPTFDEADLLDRLDGDTELLVDLVETFLSAYEGQLGELRDCYAAADFVKVARQAHAMKGALLTLSALAARHAIALESAAKEGSVETTELHLRALENELPKLGEDLQAAIARLRA